MRRSLLVCIAPLFCVACGGGGGSIDASVDGAHDAGADGGPAYPDSGPVVRVDFPAMGSIAAGSGQGSFRFGAASAATQIEDMNPDVDWYVWTEPPPAGLGKGADPVGDAVRGYSKAQEDIGLISDLGLDSYRFSIEWARVEPQRGMVSDAALQHYDDVINGLVAAGISPNVTIFHFSNPLWVDDPRKVAAGDDCSGGPTDQWLCGWGSAAGAPMIIDSIAAHACTLATRYGDRVDEWATFNEPVNYFFASYGAGQFPPGRSLVFSDFNGFLDVLRNFLRAHAAMYAAIKRCDTIDADGDGEAASVGLTLSVVDWVPARRGHRSQLDPDVTAAERMRYVYHYVVPDSLRNGTFDANFDGQAEESHPEWANTLEWLGVQYYSRVGVTAQPATLPVLKLTPCFPPLGTGTACIPPEDPTHWVPTMSYEYYERGILEILVDLSNRYPDLPFMVTEAGIATNVGRRRAENVVRELEQINFARAAGVDVRGYYHWSLTDNFEWALGFTPHFGLYGVQRSGTYPRTPTEGATVYEAIATDRALTVQQRQTYGGLGPMTPEN